MNRLGLSVRPGPLAHRRPRVDRGGAQESAAGPDEGPAGLSAGFWRRLEGVSSGSDRRACRVRPRGARATAAQFFGHPQPVGLTTQPSGGFRLGARCRTQVREPLRVSSDLLGERCDVLTPFGDGPLRLAPRRTAVNPVGWPVTPCHGGRSLICAPRGPCPGLPSDVGVAKPKPRF
jgi:hypothetical protein